MLNLFDAFASPESQALSPKQFDMKHHNLCRTPRRPVDKSRLDVQSHRSEATVKSEVRDARREHWYQEWSLPLSLCIATGVFRNNHKPKDGQNVALL